MSLIKPWKKARTDGLIGSALEAHVKLFADESTIKNMNMLGNELRFLLITSEATVHPCLKNLRI